MNLTELMLSLCAGRDVTSIPRLCDTLWVSMIPRPPLFESALVAMVESRVCMLNRLRSVMLPLSTVF